MSLVSVKLCLSPVPDFLSSPKVEESKQRVTVPGKTEQSKKNRAMEGVTHNENGNVPSEDDDQFPKDLRVLVVDDDVTCLHLLEKMLRDCSYQVTKCQRGEEALALIRENRGGFDIILTEVHMPGMDGLQLLVEIANMDITLPVVMFSSDDEKDTVAKGVKSGACDFLVKPIQITTLKILWQHVLRSNPSWRNNSTKELEMPHPLTTSSSNNTHSQAENAEENSKSLKRSSQDEADQGQTKNGAKKPRIVWTPELNQTFIMAVNSLGDDNAKPKKILQIMRKMTGLPHLTRQHVSSHLQKYRRNSNKIGPSFADLTPPSSPLIGCGGLPNCVASAQYPSRAMSIAQCTSCMSMPKLEFPNNEAHPRYQMGLQSQPFTLLQQPNPFLENYGRKQQVNESVQCPSYAAAPELDVPVAFGTIEARANESCGEFCYPSNHYPVAEDCQVHGNEAMLDQNIFEDLGFGEHFPFLDSYIQHNGAM